MAAMMHAFEAVDRKNLAERVQKLKNLVIRFSFDRIIIASISQLTQALFQISHPQGPHQRPEKLEHPRLC